MNEYLKHIELPAHFGIDLSFDDTKAENIVKATHSIIAKVVNLSDKAIVEAIKDFAIKHGYSDIYLMDEEFIMTALKNELERRMQNGRKQS